MSYAIKIYTIEPAWWVLDE